MNYLSRLDEARRHLVTGDFLAAERQYWAAREAFEKSRLRAPLEKGVDPLLRLGARVFGRDPNKPVLATFPEREAQMLVDLRDVAALLQRQAREKATVDGDQLAAEDVEVLGRALLLQRESRIFRLPEAEIWPVTRGYLDGAQRLGRSVDVDSLPRLVLDSDAALWLIEWGGRRRRRQGDDARALSNWLMDQLEAHLAPTAAFAQHAQALSLATRLMLDDPIGAPAALDFGRRALHAPAPPADALRLLRIVTGLACNEERLAVGCVDPVVLHELGDVAARLGALWPPPEIAELLSARGFRDASALAAVSWSEHERRILVLRLEHRRPIDILLLLVPEEALSAPQPFALGLRAARQAVDRSLRADAGLLLAASPPPWVAAVIGERRQLRVDLLETALGPAPGPQSPQVNRAHPVFDPEDPLAAPWQSLLQAAQWLLPRLLAYAQRECFAPGWGLENLRALAAVGVGAADGFARAVAASAEKSHPEFVALQPVPGPLALAWPRLSSRPQARAAEAASEAVESNTDLLVLRRPSASELAASALALPSASLYVDGAERARAVAALVAAQLDPTRVTRMPPIDVCPELALRLLERWSEESLVRPERGFDVLSLYAALASAPEGDLVAELGQLTPAADELREAFAEAAAVDCRFELSGDCFRHQLAERRRNSLVCIDDLDQLGEARAIEYLLVDDPLARCVGGDDASCQEFLRRLAHAWAASSRATLWLAAPRLGAAVVVGLDAVFGARTPELRDDSAATRRLPVGLYCVPDGYRPQCGLLAQEAEALLEARLKLWSQRRGKALWRADSAQPPAQTSLPLLSGVAGAPSHPTVLVASLADGQFRSDVALLRLAAALSWTEAELVVLDPRVHELRGLLDQATGLLPWKPERALLADARSLLAEHSARELPHWRRPLAATRLRSVAEVLGWQLAPARAEELADSVAGMQDQERLLLCGASDEERLLLAATAARLARESLDGGPLGIRTVIWIGQPDTRARTLAQALELRWAALTDAQDVTLEASLLEIDAGRVQWVHLSPQVLSSDSIRRWARRGEGLLWIWPRLERCLSSHPAAQHEAESMRLRELLLDPHLRCLACLDEPTDSAWAQRAVAEFALHPAQSLAGVPEFRLLRRRLPDPELACPHCGETRPLAHSRQPCPVCGLARLDQPEPRVAAQVALAEVSARFVQRGDPQQALLLVSADEREAEQLRACMGIESRSGDSLFASGGRSYAQQVLSQAQVFVGQPHPARVILSRLPSEPRSLRALLWRLHALGWEGIEVELLDHPVAWDLSRCDDPEFGEFAPGATLNGVHWLASRPEVEFRAQQQRQSGELVTVGSRLGLGPRPQSGPPDMAELASLVAQLETAGLAFGATDAEPLQLALDRFGLGERRAVRWLVDEHLLAVTPSSAHENGSSTDALFFEAMLNLPLDTACPLPEPPPAQPSVELERSPETNAGSGPWLLGVAGSGKTTRLLERAARIPNRRRRLLLVPSSAALLPAVQASASARPRVEVATVAELELAFLRQHHQAENYAQAPRLLPSTASDEGRRLRHELMRELSRRYAVAAGSVPPIDIEDLQLVLDGRRPRIAAKAEAGGAALDLDLLSECAQAARRDTGWITTAELRRWSQEALQREEYIAEAWRHRYAAVLVDDAHAFAADELAFVEQLFPPELRSFAADPNLFEPQRSFGKLPVETISRRLPREVARAAAQLLGGDPSRRTPPRSLRRSRGEVERQRVLNLAACALRIESDWKGGALESGRNAILVSHRGDVEPLAARLRESGLEVWPVEEVARACADGPRQLFAALQLAQALQSDMPAELMADLAVVVLRAEGLLSAATDRHELARRLISWRHGVGVEAQRPAESLLLVLLDLQRRLAGVWTLAEAAQHVVDAGILARLLRSDAASERIRRLLDQDGERQWRNLPSQIPVTALADPLRSGPHLWLLRPEDAAGLEFDRVYSICSGFEPVEHHYRALGRTREHFVMLYAERDPLAERP